MSGRSQLVIVQVPSGWTSDSEGHATTTYTEVRVRGQVGPDPKTQYPLAGDQVGPMAETATAHGRLPRGTRVTRGTILRVTGRFGGGVYEVTSHSEDRRGVYVRCIDKGDA